MKKHATELSITKYNILKHIPKVIKNSKPHMRFLESPKSSLKV